MSQMILSVVIVNYNVKFFLEQCLSSLKKAVGASSLLHNQTEIFIVDNASTDGSLAYLQQFFPDFHFIQNKDNKGFSKANNQAIHQCSGEYILFLNPDTILAEDSLDSCISFFRLQKSAGAVGVRMIDGAGRFLKESKRGFPGIWASFFKMTGLTKLFPHSRIFSSYYMGHLDENKSHIVDVLSGAFLMTKKTVLEKTGGFDEQFFMYGEDIDLSYRIQQQGYLNYYFADTTIIHFKGESTSSDIRYVNLFYKAMILFMKKHFRGVGFSIQLFFLSMAVRFHQSMAYLFRPGVYREKDDRISTRTTIIKGDPEVQKKWKQSFVEQNIPANNKTDKKQIIFCEGFYLSWKEIIKEISDNPNIAVYLFHGSGTHAAVSSNSSRHRGDYIEI
jgi:N-acetylglucosaminyl-diphospho-decaprenol L-rhamnosyltransferase